MNYANKSYLSSKTMKHKILNEKLITYRSMSGSKKWCRYDDKDEGIGPKGREAQSGSYGHLRDQRASFYGTELILEKNEAKISCLLLTTST